MNPTPYKVGVSDDLYHFIHDLWLENQPIGELSWHTYALELGAGNSLTEKHSSSANKEASNHDSKSGSGSSHKSIQRMETEDIQAGEGVSST